MTPAFESLAAGSLINITALLFLLALLRRNILLTAERRRAYYLAILTTIAVMLLEVACAALEVPNPALRIPSFVANVLGFALSSALPYIVAVAYDERLARRWRLTLLPSAVFGGLCAMSFYTGWIFSISPENLYVRGPWFPVYLAVFLGGLVLLLIANFHQAARFFRWEKYYLALLYVLFFAGISLQLLQPALHTSWQCVTLALLLYYIFQRELQFKYDLLTGVLNRSSFIQALEQPLPIGTLLIVFDLDHFKAINDQSGHQAGDECLRAAASVLRECFSDIGPCYRIGGDEFVVLGPGNEDAVRHGAKNMVARIEALRVENPLLPNISYGCSRFEKGESIHTVFQRADAQMYQFKGRCPPDSENFFSF